MKTRFDNKISRMKEQKLSFANDGVEVTLSVPDTNEVKDVFTYTASTLSSQQQQVLALQATISHMAEDNARAQNNIIAWATKCMEDLQEQNKQLQERLKETELQLTRKLKNLEYNTQGYVDNQDLPPKSVSAEANAMIFNLGSNEPPKILKTSVPTVSPDPDLSTDESTLVYNTKRDEEYRSVPDTTANVDIAAQNELTMEKAEAIIKRRAKLEESKKYYQSIGPPKTPTSPSHRWKWAYKKVLRIIRLKSSKIGLSRSRVTPGHSVADRLERIEHAIYEIPVTLRAHIHQKTTELKKQVDEQFRQVESTMAEDRKTTKQLCNALGERIDGVNVRVDEVTENLKATDDRLTKLDEFLQEYIKNQEAILDEKINSVHDRITTMEIVQLDAIRHRIRDLLDRTGQLKMAAAAISSTLVIDPELDINPDGDLGSKELYNLMKMDTNLWKSRAAISTVEGNVFTISELLHSLTRDITTAFSNEQSRIPPELKDDILNECKGMDDTLVLIGEDMNGVTDLWKEHEGNIAKRWESVAKLAEMAKVMKNLTSELTAMTEGLEVVKNNVTDLSTNLDGVNTQVKTNTNDVEVAQGHIKVMKEEISTLQKINPQDIVDKSIEKSLDKLQSNKIGPIEEKLNSLSGDLSGLSGDLKDLSVDLKDLKSNQYTGSGGPSEVVREIKAPDNLEELINGIIQSYLPGLTPVVQTIVSSAPAPASVPKSELHLERGQFEIENQNPDEEEPEIVPAETRIRLTTDDENYGRPAVILVAPSNPQHKYVAKFVREEPKPTVDLEQIERLQNQIAAISNNVQLICSDLTGKADVTLLEDKVSYDVVSLVEKSVEDVIFDLGNTKTMTEVKLQELRMELLEALMRAIKKALEDRENERLTLLSTKQLCMGCGRSSSVASNVLPGPSGTNFQSALNAHSTNGPDVYRGGFKMPVRARSPTIGMSNPNAFDPKEITALFNQSINQINDEDVTDSPENLSRTDERPQLDSPSSWIDNVSSSHESPVKQISLAVKAVRHAQGREESAMLRPIHRKCFPGSKSLRAQTAYGPAPPRFEPPLDLSRHMNELLSAHSSVISAPVIKNKKQGNDNDSIGIRFTQSGFL